MTNLFRALAVCLPLFAVGCATPQYPDLPADVPRPVQPVTPLSGTSSAAPEASPVTTAVEQSATAMASNAPVPQEVNPPPPDPASLPGADRRRLEVRLSDRRFAYFEDDQIVWRGRVSAGAGDSPTPQGEFRVTAKDIDKRSGSYTNSFDWPTPMPYALQFKGPYWVHEGYVPLENASKGCVRLRHEDAKFVYARMRVGDTIKILK
jgi:lipoprotein-anchoring transpeptidase ErfK/SrfK